jgi:hypothetical protein
MYTTSATPLRNAIPGPDHRNLRPYVLLSLTFRALGWTRMHAGRCELKSPLGHQNW